jgi:regulator of CtrA degradation
MVHSASLTPRIVEALYCEALVLSDEVRAAFTLPGRVERARVVGAPENLDEDLTRIALSSEGLRTTTRMMHAIAWLLNHRAYFVGEISDVQLRRHGQLSSDMRLSDPQQTALLPAATAHLVDNTQHFYERLLRLDQAWRLTGAAAPSAIETLRERIERRLAS